MDAVFTKHAAVRAQQRGIPQILDEVLDLYGQEQHVGGGVTVRYMNRSSIKMLTRDLDPRRVKSLEPWFGTYKATGNGGQTITIGHRTHRIRRK